MCIRDSTGIDEKLKERLAVKEQEAPTPLRDAAIPVYREDAMYAFEAGELGAYRTSMQANMDCKEAIEPVSYTHLVVRHYQHHTERSANKPFEKVSKLEQKAEAADRKLHFEKTVAEDPEMKTSRANMNKHYQKQHIKKEYAAARKAGAQTASTLSLIHI